MTVYAIAQITIHDREGYERYGSKFIPVLRRFGGWMLAADDGPVVLEGDSPVEKVVMVSFPDRAKFDAWWDSEDYREIAKDRIASTEGPLLLVHGLDEPR